LLRESLDPAIFQEASKSAIKCPSAQSNASPAERFDVFEEGVPVAGAVGQAEQDQEDGLGEGLVLRDIRSLHDRSSDDILRRTISARQLIFSAGFAPLREILLLFRAKRMLTAETPRR
jgi:hypothetical protein